MTQKRRTLLICNCEGTMPLDGARVGKACGGDGAVPVKHQLCRAEIGDFRQALDTGEPLLVACTQEAPLFEETRHGHAAGGDVCYVNIRERAGWSDEAADADPKIAALLAEASVEVPGAPTLTLKSEGRLLVYGSDTRALEAARQLKGRLDVTLLLTGPGDVIPPGVNDIPLLGGTISSASGHLGAFELMIEGGAPAVPSSRGELAFARAGGQTAWTCDLILDLSGADPLFSAHDKRDGYFRPERDNPAAVQRALFDLVDLVGEFEKPRYVEFNAGLCAHSRSRKTGCTRCLDVCPTSAIQSAGDTVAIDPAICGGCGGCGSVCPTGASSYALPSREALHQRLRTLLGAYFTAGGTAPVLLIHDRRHGDEMIDALARFGRGLPARVIPFVLNEVSQIGFEFLAVAFAYGAARILLLVDPKRPDDRPGLAGQVEFAQTMMSGLGFGDDRLEIIDASDPEVVEEALWRMDVVPGAEGGRFQPVGARREVTRLALHHLHAVAPDPVDVVALPKGAPFGRVTVNRDGCTLCLACVGACPTGALQDDPEKPRLSFSEDACIQCGLCRNTCPEQVITLEPRLNFTEGARTAVELNEAEPFFCIRCGKPIGAKASIEKIMEKLGGVHSMFMESAQMERIKMCADCRVIDAYESGEDPMAGNPRPNVRTTEDYLREREARRKADSGSDDPQKH